MTSRTVTVQQAMDRGVRLIERPSMAIVVGSTILCPLAMIYRFDWRELFIVPAGILLSVFYGKWALPRWRIWAYGAVNDIHQLQRAAEFAAFLKPQSQYELGGFMSPGQIAVLEELQEKFAEDAIFVDDAAIPGETIVYDKTLFPFSKTPVLTLSTRGIDMEEGDFFAWSEIRDVHVARVSYAREDMYMGGETRSAGSNAFFRFRYEDYGLVDIKMSSMAIDAWKLDLLLYTYQGRFNRQK